MLGGRGWWLWGRQDPRRCVGRCGWASVLIRMVRVEYIIMSDWVGSIDQVPCVSLSVNLNAKWRVDMDADLPKVCRHNYLLLASPNTEIKRLRNVSGIGVVGVSRPKSGP